MPPTTGPIDTPERVGNNYVVPVKAATKINAGSLVVWDAGFAAPGRTGAGLLVIGRAEEMSDNLLSPQGLPGVAGAKSVTVRRGVFKFANDLADPITQANVGANAFIVDDQTVCKTAAGKSRAGQIVQLDADGVWVDTRD